ncbi:hypothetical protein GPECTOR_13g844 [Gonium pectorale]|uniref:Protein kinase domain-containing protein n=1 Tax=Gonium pectorale TaxID=33097 RepID=A0A150GNB8_GONPE|nr:hypothetical protein GPECTOR_13g844 [Gonium pectorale]|eukprot:KXZ51356.1 hypothetical protein GPECTOR_13g844 [Gonium pectorale]
MRAALVAAAVTLGVVALRFRKGLTAAGHEARPGAHAPLKEADRGHCSGAHGTTGFVVKAGQHAEAREQCSSYGTPASAACSSLTPPRADVLLDVKPGPAGEVTLLPTVLGKGGFGRVVEGMYQGHLVAVKLILDLSLDTWGLPADAATVAQGANAGGCLTSNDNVPEKRNLEDTVTEGTHEGKDNQAAAGEDGVDAVLRARECRAGSGPEPGPHACVEDHGVVEAQGGGAPAAEAGRAGTMGTVVAQLAAALAQEVTVLSRCHHPNIVTLLAACLTPPRLCLVMERCETSLDKLLYGRPGQLLPMEQVLSLALDVARGLEYLHPTVVHRDLKPANVLVNHPGGPDMVAKVADFGVSRLRDTVAVVTANPEVGTPEFMAPELYALNNNIVTNKVDVYSFGVLLWAMLSGKRPWEGMPMVVIAVRRVTLHRERPGMVDVPADRRSHKLERLMRQCWDSVPERRPAAAELVKELLLAQEQMARRAG